MQWRSMSQVLIQRPPPFPLNQLAAEAMSHLLLLLLVVLLLLLLALVLLLLCQVSSSWAMQRQHDRSALARVPAAVADERRTVASIAW